VAPLKSEILKKSAEIDDEDKIDEIS
jgi:hypothetical protein